MATRTIQRTQHGSNALAPRVRPRIDLDEDFSDVSGDPGGEFALEGADTSRKYVFAHNSVDDIANFKRDVCGYIVETLTETGVCPQGQRGLLKLGESITVRDHVLMSCDREKWEKRQRYLNKKTIIANREMARARMADVVIDDDPEVTRQVIAKGRVGLDYGKQART